jgi:Ser/Thr protein kinase RdoA (MazF antagonist)
VVLDAAESAGLVPDGRLLALNSYENRVYRVGLEQPLATARSGGGIGDVVPGQAVAKFYREGRWTDAQIREEHAFTIELAAEALPVAAPLVIGGATLHRHAGFRFALFECRAGTGPDLDRPGDRQLLGRTLGRLHATGSRATFRHRDDISRWRHGARARELVLASGLVPEPLEARYAELSGLLVKTIAHRHRAAGAMRQLRLHGDCHPGNILWQATGPLFVDFDDTLSGPAVQDLWMFAAGSPEQMRREWSALLEGYEQFAHLQDTEVLLIEALRATRMLNHAAWIAQRWTDPAFPLAFPWFGEPRYWERHLDELREQLPAVDDPPLLRA